jgi:hypothetical protein
MGMRGGQTPHRDKAASRGTMGHRPGELQSTPSPPFHTRVRAWGEPGDDLPSPSRGSELGTAEADGGMLMLSVNGAAAAGAEAGRAAAVAGMGLDSRASANTVSGTSCASARATSSRQLEVPASRMNFKTLITRLAATCGLCAGSPTTSPSYHTDKLAIKKSPPKSAATRRQQQSPAGRPTLVSARNAERATVHTSHSSSATHTDGSHGGAGHTSVNRSPQQAFESTSSLGTASADGGGAWASAGSSRAGLLSGLLSSTHRSPSPVKHRQQSAATPTRRSPSSSRSSSTAAAAAAAAQREKKDRLPSLSVNERHHKGDATVSVASPR